MASPNRLQEEQDKDVKWFGIFCFILLLAGLFLCPIVSNIK